MALHIEARGSGRPLVVLPSFRLDHAAMSEAFEPAFGAVGGWRRLYVDLPGTGGSPAGAPRSDAVLDQVVATIRAELARERFAVIGWSYGGYLAAGVTRHLPGQVGGLMMVCTGFKIRPEDRDLTGVRPSAQQPGWLAPVPAPLHDHLTHAVGVQTAGVGARIAAALRRNGPTDEPYLTALREGGFPLGDEDTPTPCDAPVCFLAGQRDRVVGFAGLAAALGSYDAATYTCVSDAGHYLPLEQPAVFAAVLWFWLARCHAFLDAPDD